MRLIALIAVLVATIFNGRFLITNGWGAFALDFEVFWRAAGAPLSEIYRPADMPFAYPPTALILFFPLRLVDLQTGFTAWTLLSIGVFAYGVTRLCGPLIASISLFSGAAVHGLVLGQVPMFLAGLTFFALTLPPFASGLVLAFVAVVKPQLMLFAPLALLVRKNWSILRGMAVGGAAFALLSVALFGLAVWQEWLSMVSTFGSSMHSSITPAGQAARHGFPKIPVLAASIAISSLAVVTWSKKIEGATLIALIVAASLAASPYGHAHDTIAIVPACIAMLGNPLTTLPAFLIFTGPQVVMVPAMVAGLALCICANIKALREEGPA